MRDWVAHRAVATPDRTALVDVESGTTLTYGALDDAVDQAAGRLAGIGVGPGDHLGVLAETGTHYARLLHAAMRIGARLVALNPREPADRIVTAAQKADVDAIVCDGDTASVAKETAIDPIACVDSGFNLPGLDAIEPAQVSATTWSRTDPQLLLFTSGSTGEPKPVILTTGNLLASATASAFRLGVTPSDRWLVTLPMYHMGGLAPVIRSALYGTTAVVRRGADPREIVAAADAYEVTGISLVPTLLSRILKDGGSFPGSLRFVLLGGGPIQPELIERCAGRNIPIYPTYGLTEAASQVATATPDEAFSNPKTVGRPLLFTDVTVVDDTGSPVERGVAGEVIVDGPTMSPGYYADQAATEEAFRGLGFHTGDRGVLDEDGRLEIIGRADDRILTGGEVVHPAPISATIRTHEQVTDVAIVGLEDSEWGERVAALVEHADGSDLTADDIAAFCQDRLAAHERPKTIVVTDALPRTPSGTIDRNRVRERLGQDP